MAHTCGLTPNQVTLLSGATTGTAVVLVATLPPAAWAGAAIWFLLAVGFMLDSADGQLARLRGGGSRAGEWLDHVLDAGKMAAVHAAVLISWYRFFDLPESMLLVPLAFQLCAVVTFAGGTLTELLKRTAGSADAGRPASALRSVLLVPADYGVFCLVFLAYGAPWLFTVLYSAFAAAAGCFAVLLLAKWFKELKQA
ncbi:CDP-alcohol phosphatidyltransferase family protein [Arthrobacter sp. GCM10027362]|uniref:CDP-alcohol phosphatidyltransferase family protein n=1 Tax=Arthrobacter sp. GCM10027362 TaxID=3273379 RepID=UPI0036350CD5